jgi:23S rRNA (guanine745-N1)-methyltransferase
LKQVLYENPYENEEKRETYPGFRYVDVIPVENRFTLPEGQAIADLFRMTPYFWKTPRAGGERLAALDRLTVTAQFQIHVLEKG